MLGRRALKRRKGRADMDETTRQRVIAFFENLSKEAQSCADQLKNGDDVMYTTSSHIVSAAAEFWFEFGPGVDPKTGELMFRLYLPCWAKTKLLQEKEKTNGN